RGRATVVQREPRRVVRPSPRLAGEPGVVGWLADAVGAEERDRGLVRHLLADVLVVEDWATARRLHDRGVAAAIVTRAGQLIEPDGSMTAGRGEGLGAHMIAVKREIRELAGLVGRLDAELAVAVAKHGELRSGIASRRAELDAARTEAHDAEIAIVKAEKDL